MKRVGLSLLALLSALVFVFVFKPERVDISSPASNGRALGSVSDSDSEQSPEEIEKAVVNVAEEYVTDADYYQDNNGKNLEVVEVLQEDCSGCWLIKLKFDGASIGQVEVKITLIDAKVKEVFYAKGGVDILTEVECLAKKGRVVDTSIGDDCKPEEAIIAEISAEENGGICCMEVEKKLDQEGINDQLGL